MKKLALIILGFLFYFEANAQFERVVPENGFARFLRTLKGDYVLVYNSEDAAVFDEKGQSIMNLDYDTPVGGYWNAFDLIDTSVVFTGGAFSFDQFGWFGIPFNRQFDSNWQDIVTVGYLGQDVPFAEKMVDGGFVFYDLNNGYVSRRSATGDFVWDFYEQGLEILDISCNVNSQTIAASIQGLMVLDSNGTADTLFAIYDFTQIETISFGNLVGAKADTVYLLDSNFTVIQKAPIPLQVVKNMKSMEDKVAVLTESNHVYLYDQDLLPINDFQLDYDHLTFKNIVPDQDGIVLAGDHHYGQYPKGNGAIFIKKFGVDGFDPFERRDIGLYFIQSATQTDVWPENGKFKVKFHNVKFQLFNYGDTVLNSFQVNVRFPSLPPVPPLQPNHTEQHYWKQFSNLNLAPGQNTTLTWDEFTATFVNYPSGSNLELCFWSSMPDGKSDINPNNDVACGNFLVNDEEVQSNKVGFDVFPNPTNATCYLRINIGQTSEAELRVYDSTGRQIQSFQISPSTNFLELADLVKGLNFVVMISDGVVVQSEKVLRN